MTLTKYFQYSRFEFNVDSFAKLPNIFNTLDLSSMLTLLPNLYEGFLGPRKHATAWLYLTEKQILLSMIE